MNTANEIDAASWIRSWENQQNAYIMEREERFQFMFDLLESLLGREAKILDLGCGPGSLSGRLIERFPGYRAACVDYDPVLLHLLRHYEGYDHSRLRIIEADMGSDGWDRAFEEEEFDAALSTTALHWLQRDSLERLYSSVHGLLRKGGILLNGDHLYPEMEENSLRSFFREVRKARENDSLSNPGALTWSQWWEELRKESSLVDLFRERDRRYRSTDNHNHEVSLESHMQFLKQAGFETVGVAWQILDNRVLAAIK